MNRTRASSTVEDRRSELAGGGAVHDAIVGDPVAATPGDEAVPGEVLDVGDRVTEWVAFTENSRTDTLAPG
jgi:hypothetical protein